MQSGFTLAFGAIDSTHRSEIGRVICRFVRTYLGLSCKGAMGSHRLEAISTSEESRESEPRETQDKREHKNLAPG
jgi:hypothetical protein